MLQKADEFFPELYAGFLTTCGLRNVGNACEYNGELFGSHGRIEPTRRRVNTSVDWVDNVPEMTVSGKIREASFSAKIYCWSGVLLAGTAKIAFTLATWSKTRGSKQRC